MTSFDDGCDAAFADEPISSCPWSASDVDGAAWREGWLTAERAKRDCALIVDVDLTVGSLTATARKNT